MSSGELSRAMRADEHSVLEASAHWYSVMHADNVSDEDRQQWQAWLGADPVHRNAWDRVMSISRKFESMPPALNARAAGQALSAAGGLRRRQSLKLLGALCTVGITGILTARSHSVSALFAQYRTGVGQQRQLQLADGTEVWLNTDTAIDVDYNQQIRQVTLRSGEILIKTAPDVQRPYRPFQVSTAQGILTPLGTRFTVRSEGDSANVAVFEGAVEVIPQHSAGQVRSVVHAGLQMSFSDEHAGDLTPAETWRQDWIHGVIAADDMRLDDFVRELNRYHHGILSCAPEVADLRIVGAFPVGNVAAILAALESTLPISTRQHTRWWISIQKKSS